MNICTRFQDFSASLLKGAAVAGVISGALFAGSASADQIIYSNGFETNTAGWTSTTRASSGTGGVTSSSGAYHGTTSSTSNTQWGGYNFGAGAAPTAFREYWTSVDIYLNVGGGFANDTRLDFSSAINNAAGAHLSDFIFNGGFYNAADLTGPGAGTSRFVFSASNNSQPTSANAKNPDRNPIAISNTGWYTFEHHFYNNAGNLAVEMRIIDSADAVLQSWTLSVGAQALLALVATATAGLISTNSAISPSTTPNCALCLNRARSPCSALGWSRWRFAAAS